MKKIKSAGLKNRALKQMTTLIIFAMIVMVMLFYGIVYSRTIRNQGKNQEKSLANLDAYLNSYFEEADSIAKNVNYNYYLQNYLETVIDREDNYTDPSVGKNMRAYEMSSQAFSDTLLSRPDISSVMIFGRKKVLLNKSLYSLRNVVMDYSDLEWYQEAIKNPYDMVITGPNHHRFFDTDDEAISLSREIQDYENGTFLGVILVNLNMNKITEICDSFKENTTGALAIVNEAGEKIYLNSSSTGMDIQNLNLKELIETAEQYSESTFRTRLDGTEYFITKKKMKSTGWNLVHIIPQSWLLADLWKISMLIVTAVAGTLLVTLFSLNRILTNVIRPLKKLERHMGRVSLENLSEKVDITTDDEIGHLAGNFNSMLERIENLKEQVVEEQEDKRKYELQALQAQINPHFLYNTLDSIIWMAEGRKYEEVVLMTASLARLLRQSISNEDEVVPLAREVEYAKGYLTIQKMRYKDKLEFEIDVEPSILNIPLIKLVLQPIIENAIYHGLKYKESKGLLQVKGFMKDGNAILQVIDNGVGMDEETLSHIYDKHKVNYHSNGVGVYNVQKRLKLYYGENYGITYESEKGVGTTATITIPGIQEESI